MTIPAAPFTHLPADWVGRPPGPQDVADLVDLRGRHETAARGGTSGAADVAAEVTGPGAAVREHLIVRDPDDRARGWATVHDRAAGRVLVAVVVDPGLEGPVADALSTTLFDWAADAAAGLARARGLSATQLDSGAFEADPRQQAWLAAAGYSRVRTWWQMRRPVTDADSAIRVDDRVRPVRREHGGMPAEADLLAVHDVLEQAFADHFNHHEETFDEFLARLRADPGHRWDHWWLAEPRDGAPAGALVASAVLDDEGRTTGSYVDYLGVLRSARGQGLASALLDAVVGDAARRGRSSVALEVDADSPTGAADLYLSLGFVTRYVTQSWHRDLRVDET
ncbi:GNAT family N-acetyltransferase [Isoptericola sp. b441]|uniref:GNAT family N-acetyltransferase n=1 Tax=Actinotalea lenta TaxID=3064654 RepID=A0ABT9D5S0_9CELL|nr:MULTISPECIES: GNAT family N-acetyltransferase [unclassified Isoptericola]MDO8105835.1 GNAT family N-acetyltransferase [Isoptericola sp. b441]MDO8122540.1 GNAT family N-acetyltransferase [Isoptericola sp. b490]